MYIKNLKIGDKVECIQDKYANYDVGLSGMVVSGVAFEKGKKYNVIREAYGTVGCAYVRDPDDGCLHGVTDEYFKKV